MAQSYDDILNTPYPLTSHDEIHHPRMPIAERAKIFSPFAALRGYEDAIAGKTEISEIDLSMTAETFEESE